ncbi:MAG: hypothetical protein K0U64_05470 [Actinomycetia bacterium]|nr:hypothetical protein [Actinomycetes bacterium]
MTERKIWESVNIRAEDLSVGDVTLVRKGTVQTWWMIIGLVQADSDLQDQFRHVPGLANAYADLVPGEILVLVGNTRSETIYQRHQSYDLLPIQAPIVPDSAN